jgi:hypothetical protein
MIHYMQMILLHRFHHLQPEFLKEFSSPLGNPNEESQFFKVKNTIFLLFGFIKNIRVNNNMTSLLKHNCQQNIDFFIKKNVWDLQ